jgi:hypothetical protein
MGLPILIAIAAAGVLGLGLILWGWRGRRIDDHPLCRRCRFDLVGNPGGLPETCPECGAQIRGRVRIGNRRPRRRLMAAGAMLALICLGVAASGAWGHLSGINWQKHKPMGLLKWEAEGARTGAVAAVEEVIRRVRAEQVKEAELGWWIEQGLAHQANTAQAWQVEWGNLIELGREMNMVSDEAWKRYAEQAVVLTLEPRARVRVGDPVPFTVCLMDRVGKGNRLALEIVIRPAAIDGVPSTIDEKIRMNDDKYGAALMIMSDNGLYPQAVPSKTEVRVEAEDPLIPRAYSIRWPQVESLGVKRMTVPLKVTISENPPGTPQNARPPDRALLYARDVEVEGAFQVVADSEAPIRRVVTDDLRRQFMQNTSVQSLSIQSPRNGPPRVQIQVSFKPIPADIAFEAFLRVGGREWPAGSHAYRAINQHGTTLGFFRATQDLEVPPNAQIDVILRPSEDAARRHPSITEIYGEEIILENVQLARPLW